MCHTPERLFMWVKRILAFIHVGVPNVLYGPYNFLSDTHAENSAIFLIVNKKGADQICAFSNIFVWKGFSHYKDIMINASCTNSPY